MKYVYLIQSLGDSHYKIGVSINPKRRMIILQTGHPHKLKLVDKYQSEFAYQIEKILHRRYKHLHTEGEWFYMDISNEVNFKKECQQIEENIVFLKKNGNVFL